MLHELQNNSKRGKSVKTDKSRTHNDSFAITSQKEPSSHLESHSLSGEDVAENAMIYDDGNLDILDKIQDVDKDERKISKEIALFNVPKGRYIFAQTLVSNDRDYEKVKQRKISLYSRHQKTYVIEITRDRFKRACENARNRVRQEKIDFLK